MFVICIRVKECDVIIQLFKLGVMLRIGIQYIQVGCVNEIIVFYQDIERIVDGGVSFRFIIGEYGFGKMFFLSVVCFIVLEKKLVLVSVDFFFDRCIYLLGGQVCNFYFEFMKNMFIRNKLDGNVLFSVVERFVMEVRKEVDMDGFEVLLVIYKCLVVLLDMVGGYDFVKVIDVFWWGYEQDNEMLKFNVICWLCGEYIIKIDVCYDFDVWIIILDVLFYDFLKLMSFFVCQVGYVGFLVSFDEMVNFLKLNNM